MDAFGEGGNASDGSRSLPCGRGKWSSRFGFLFHPNDEGAQAKEAAGTLKIPTHGDLEHRMSGESQ
jgi:hypothetical protein